MMIEQIIDEMQASLTKLRGRLRDRGKKETATEVVMREDTDRRIKHFHDCRDLYNWLNGKTDKKPPMADKIFKKVSDPTPDLPLNARVAKALPKKIMLSQAGWEMLLRIEPPEYPGHEAYRWHPIPDYPNDLEAAMGAFQEYAEKNRHPNLHIYPQAGGSSWCIDVDNCGIQPCGKNLALLICEAIVAHAEGN